MKRILNITLSALLCLAICVLTITVSIGLPIYFRPFYYMQIEDLRLPEITGYDVDTIKAAFDELLNFLTLPGQEFGTGVFAYSEDGAEHFRDCKKLFDLNITALIISLAVIVMITYIHLEL